jgi:hypothetical protein
MGQRAGAAEKLKRKAEMLKTEKLKGAARKGSGKARSECVSV